MAAFDYRTLFGGKYGDWRDYTDGGITGQPLPSPRTAPPAPPAPYQKPKNPLSGLGGILAGIGTLENPRFLGEYVSGFNDTQAQEIERQQQAEEARLRYGQWLADYEQQRERYEGLSQYRNRRDAIEDARRTKEWDYNVGRDAIADKERARKQDEDDLRYWTEYAGATSPQAMEIGRRLGRLEYQPPASPNGMVPQAGGVPPIMAFKAQPGSELAAKEQDYQIGGERLRALKTDNDFTAQVNPLKLAEAQVALQQAKTDLAGKQQDIGEDRATWPARKRKIELEVKLLEMGIREGDLDLIMQGLQNQHQRLQNVYQGMQNRVFPMNNAIDNFRTLAPYMPEGFETSVPNPLTNPAGGPNDTSPLQTMPATGAPPLIPLKIPGEKPAKPAKLTEGQALAERARKSGMDVKTWQRFENLGIAPGPQASQTLDFYIAKGLIKPNDANDTTKGYYIDNRSPWRDNFFDEQARWRDGRNKWVNGKTVRADEAKPAQATSYGPGVQGDTLSRAIAHLKANRGRISFQQMRSTDQYKKATKAQRQQMEAALKG